MQTWALGGITLNSILAYTPQQPLLAALAMLALFAFKSLTIVIPLNLLYAVNGVLFSPALAYSVDIIGTAVDFSIPYWIGKKAGVGFQNKLLEKYPKLKALNDIRAKNDFYFCALIRMIGIAPADIVSLLLGSMDIRYLPYITGCVFGFIPHMLAFTTLGSSASNANWSVFIAAILAEVLIMILAIVLRRRHSAAHVGKAEGKY